MGRDAGTSNLFTSLRVTEPPSLSQTPARVWRASSCTRTCVGWRPGRTAPPQHPRKVGPHRFAPHGSARPLGWCPRRRNPMKAGSLLGSQASSTGGEAGRLRGPEAPWEEPASWTRPPFREHPLFAGPAFCALTVTAGRWAGEGCRALRERRQKHPARCWSEGVASEATATPQREPRAEEEHSRCGELAIVRRKSRKKGQIMKGLRCQAKEVKLRPEGDWKLWEGE